MPARRAVRRYGFSGRVLVEYRIHVFRCTTPGESMPGTPKSFGLVMLVLAAQFCAAPSKAAPPGYQSDTRAYNLAHGRTVFTGKCMRCHEGGRRGAPIFGNTEDWEERLEQPLDTLIEHAIFGHGRMPARGEQDLGDQEIAAAVAYVVNRTRVIAGTEGKLQPAPADVRPAGQMEGASDYAVLQMFLLLLGKNSSK